MKKIVFCLIIVFSCNPTPCRKSNQALSKEIELNDLTSTLFSTKSENEFSDFLLMNPDFLIPFFELSVPLVKEDVSQVYSLIDNVFYDSLYVLTLLLISIQSFSQEKNYFFEIEDFQDNYSRRRT